MKRKILTMLIFILLFISITSSQGRIAKADTISKQNTAVSKITLSKNKMKLRIDKKITLTATLAPASTKQKITWSSSNKNIATVNTKGIVTAKKEGIVTITAKTNNGKTASCKITVYVPNDINNYSKSSDLYGYSEAFFDEDIFNWYANQYANLYPKSVTSVYSVYKSAIDIIFPEGTQGLEDWEIIRNTCYWATDDFVQNGKKSIFKKEYRLLTNDYKTQLDYSDSASKLCYVVRKLLGILGYDVLYCPNTHNYTLLAVKIDGDWYYMYIGGTVDEGHTRYKPIFLTGEYVKKSFDEEFVDVLKANHNDYSNGCKVWYIESLDHLLSEKGIIEFSTRMEESKFTINTKTYIGIGIGLKKENCVMNGGAYEFLIAKNGKRTEEELLFEENLYDVYPSIYIFGYDDYWTVCEYQLGQACAVNLGYKVIAAATENWAAETYLYRNYAYSTSIYQIESNER